MKYRIVSLGCPKNLVESEYIAGRLDRAGHTLADDAGLVVVNTCAFIADACSESIETILGEAQKKTGAGARLVVTGCLVDRYGDELAGLLPEVDLFVGKEACGSIERLVTERGFFTRCGEGEGASPARVPRKVLTPPPTAYLKIQEGCNNRCSYCTIPSIKGPLRSRPLLSIEEEFRTLLAGGYREFNVIGQDTTSYGRDAGQDIGRLLVRLLSIKGDYFIRLLYMHPKGIDEGLLDLIRSDDRIVPYLDIPIQHSEDRLLASMNRGYSRRTLEGLFGKIKSDMPDAVLRTTVMVGYPGETEEEFWASVPSFPRGSSITSGRSSIPGRRELLRPHERPCAEGHQEAAVREDHGAAKGDIGRTAPEAERTGDAGRGRGPRGGRDDGAPPSPGPGHGRHRLYQRRLPGRGDQDRGGNLHDRLRCGSGGMSEAS